MWKIAKLAGLGILFFLFLSFASAKEQKVSERGYEIIADSDSYSCHAINVGDYCLITAKMQIVNSYQKFKDVELALDSSSEITMSLDGKSNYVKSKLNKKTQLAGHEMNSSKKFRYKVNGNTKLDGQSSNEIIVSFWINESGKFDYLLGDDISIVKLDPYYNITYNASYPSLSLIDGASNTIPDSSYNSSVDITSGLNDGSDATAYQTGNVITQQNSTGNITASGFWKFEEGSGNATLDSSGHGNIGSIQGSQYVASKGTNGTGNYSLNFNMVNRFINIPKSSSIAVTGRNLTIASWVYFSTLPNASKVFGIMTKSDGNSAGYLLLVYNDSTASLKLQFRLNGITQSEPYAFQAGRWYHIVGLYNYSRTDVYINGVRVSGGVAYGGAVLDSNTSLFIGKDYSERYFAGMIDEVGVFNYSMSGVDILNLYNNGFNTALSNVSSGAYAVRPSFNHSVNSSNIYWLKLRKTSSGVDMIRVHPYINSSEINSSKYIDYTFHTGWDFIPINSVIADGYMLPFRIFYMGTDKFAYFSEALLVEQVEDSTAPFINSCQINDSELKCGETERLSCTATDSGIGVDKVYFGWNNSVYHYEEVDKELLTDVFYRDVSPSYTFDARTEYFLSANASDALGNWNNHSVMLPYINNCSCVSNFSCDVWDDCISLGNNSWKIDCLAVNDTTCGRVYTGNISEFTRFGTGICGTQLASVNITVYWNVPYWENIQLALNIYDQYPFVAFNTTDILEVIVRWNNGSRINVSLINMTLTKDGSDESWHFDFTYNSSSRSYWKGILFDELGDFPFKIDGSDPNQNLFSITGKFFVRNMTNLTVELFTSKNSTDDRYYNQFGYVMVTLDRLAPDFNNDLISLAEPLAKTVAFAEGLAGKYLGYKATQYYQFSKEVFSAPYVGGKAVVQVPLEASREYSIYFANPDTNLDYKFNSSYNYAQPYRRDASGMSEVYLGTYKLDEYSQPVDVKFYVSKRDVRWFDLWTKWAIILFFAVFFTIAIAILYATTQDPSLVVKLIVAVLFALPTLYFILSWILS